MNVSNLLKEIQIATNWTQTELAGRLNTSFATLNSWINAKSTPRNQAKELIQQLHIEVIGSDSIDILSQLKQARINLKRFNFHPAMLINDKNALDKLTLHMTYHTNNIEGSTMTLADVSHVIFDNSVLTNRTAMEQLEARNHQAALHWLINEVVNKGKDFKITEQLMIDIHTRLMNGIISNAGVYRKHSSRIMGSRVPLSNWLKIPDQMAVFTKEIDSSEDKIIENLAKTHAKFEQIHPFTDGNGRTGRLIMLAQCLKNRKYPPIVTKERKNAYYKYLELAQTKEKFAPLELFLAQSIEYTKDLLDKK